MKCINHIGLHGCNHRGDLASFMDGLYWYNDEKNSTHVVTIECVRLQEIASKCLVWITTNGDEQLWFTMTEKPWKIKKMFNVKGIMNIFIAFDREYLAPEDTDEPMELKPWSTRPTTIYMGKNEFQLI